MKHKLIFFFTFCAFVTVLFSNPFRTSAVELIKPYRISTEWVKLSAVDGKKLTPAIDKNVSLLVITFRPIKDYYTYAHTRSSEGIPLNVTVLDKGQDNALKDVLIWYPTGLKKTLANNQASYILEDEFRVFIAFDQSAEEAALLNITLLACSDKRCQPMQTEILLPPVPPTLKNAAEFPWINDLKKYKGERSSSLPAESTVSETLPDIEHAELLPEAHTSIFNKKSPDNPIQAVPVPLSKIEDPVFSQISAQQLTGTFQIDSWLRAIGIGLLAGLFLNVMPCVLPVLTMKISVLLSSEDTQEQRKKTVRGHCIFFSLGIWVWFAFLAVLSGLTGMLWGQLFQSSEAIFLMMLIVFCMGLSMFDVFHLPILDLQAGHSSSPKMQAFSTGVFTTLLATPCSGPLLGGVLAWGITKPLHVLMTVFMATGFGMSLPYLLAACFPRFIHIFPKPGSWLGTIEKILGFLLMGTAIYLFSLLPSNLHTKTLITLLIAAMSVWMWGKWGSLRGSITRRMFLGAFSVSAIVLSCFWAFLPPQQEKVPWKQFNEKVFLADLGKKAMLVEFTADWCPTCKVLERTTLNAPKLLPVLEQYSVMPVRVDMTFKNPVHEEFLKALGSASIPLLAVFPADADCKKPVILRDIYSLTDIHLALRQAKIPHKRMVEMLNPVKLLSK